MKPRVSILHSAFVYRKAAETDIRQTFERWRLLLAEQARQDPPKVVQIKRVRRERIAK